MPAPSFRPSASLPLFALCGRTDDPYPTESPYRQQLFPVEDMKGLDFRGPVEGRNQNREMMIFGGHNTD
jgi:hypothetical protein